MRCVVIKIFGFLVPALSVLFSRLCFSAEAVDSPWVRQRRLLQAAFQLKRFAACANAMVNRSESLGGRWQGLPKLVSRSGTIRWRAFSRREGQKALALRIFSLRSRTESLHWLAVCVDRDYVSGELAYCLDFSFRCARETTIENP
jgi:hypothetical protein